jgi:hypothetical protein
VAGLVWSSCVAGRGRVVRIDLLADARLMDLALTVLED